MARRPQYQSGPPGAQSYTYIVSEAALADTATLGFLVETLAFEVSKMFTQPVFIETFSAPHLRGMELRFTTRGRGEGIPPVAGKLEEKLREALGIPQSPSVFNTANTAKATTGPVTKKDLKRVTFNVGSIYNATPHPGEPPEAMFSNIPVYGFRAWRVNQFGSDFLKHPEGMLLGNVEEWETDTKVAVCRSTSLADEAIARGHAPRDHDAPHWGCHCGIYVTNEPTHGSVTAQYLVQRAERESLLYYPPSISPRAAGLVELTGVTVEHERGARGRKGQIKVLWVEEEWEWRVQQVYPKVRVIGVPEYRPKPVRRIVPNGESFTATYHYELDAEPSPHLGYEVEWGTDHIEDVRLKLIREMEDEKRRLEEPWLRLGNPNA